MDMDGKVDGGWEVITGEQNGGCGQRDGRIDGYVGAAGVEMNGLVDRWGVRRTDGWHKGRMEECCGGWNGCASPAARAVQPLRVPHQCRPATWAGEEGVCVSTWAGTGGAHRALFEK